MSIESCWNGTEKNTSTYKNKEKLLQCHFVTINPTQNGDGSNQALRGDRPPVDGTNHRTVPKI